MNQVSILVLLSICIFHRTKIGNPAQAKSVRIDVAVTTNPMTNTASYAQSSDVAVRSQFFSIGWHTVRPPITPISPVMITKAMIIHSEILWALTSATRSIVKEIAHLTNIADVKYRHSQMSKY